jgi:diguanylate cyclase (GGDEF)-like protein
LPAAAVNERVEFEREGIQSILIVPLWLGPELHGFVGFDAVRTQVEWGEHYVIGLRLMAQMLASALEARALSVRLHRQAFHDVLTGLPNRKLLEDRFEQALRRADREGSDVLLAVVDIDDFKQVNDRHGHAVGDQVLCEVGRRLQGAVRGTDTVARMGGDEFVVLADGGGGDGLAQLANRLVATCESALQIDGKQLQLGLSIGLARDLPAQGSLDGLIRRADAAMYRAKADGKNRWFEAPGLPDLHGS